MKALPGLYSHVGFAGRGFVLFTDGEPTGKPTSALFFEPNGAPGPWYEFAAPEEKPDGSVIMQICRRNGENVPLQIVGTAWLIATESLPGTPPGIELKWQIGRGFSPPAPVNIGLFDWVAR